MADEKAPDNPQDEQRVRWIYAGVLLAVVVVGSLANFYTAEERLNSIFLTAFLVAICGLVGKQIKLR